MRSLTHLQPKNSLNFNKKFLRKYKCFKLCIERICHNSCRHRAVLLCVFVDGRCTTLVDETPSRTFHTERASLPCVSTSKSLNYSYRIKTFKWVNPLMIMKRWQFFKSSPTVITSVRPFVTVVKQVLVIRLLEREGFGTQVTRVGRFTWKAISHFCTHIFLTNITRVKSSVFPEIFLGREQFVTNLTFPLLCFVCANMLLQVLVLLERLVAYETYEGSFLRMTNSSWFTT